MTLEHLKCQVSGTLTTTPGLTDSMQTVAGSLSGTLTDCESDDGSQSKIVSGTITGADSDDADCNGKSTWSGTAIITWFGQPNQQGPSLGTSVISTSGNQTAQNDTAQNTIVDDATGRVSLDSSVMPDQSVTGWALPTSNISTCSTATPLTSAAGQGELIFSGLL